MKNKWLIILGFFIFFFNPFTSFAEEIQGEGVVENIQLNLSLPLEDQLDGNNIIYEEINLLYTKSNYYSEQYHKYAFQMNGQFTIEDLTVRPDSDFKLIIKGTMEIDGEQIGFIDTQEYTLEQLHQLESISIASMEKFTRLSFEVSPIEAKSLLVDFPILDQFNNVKKIYISMINNKDLLIDKRDLNNLEFQLQIDTEDSRYHLFGKYEDFSSTYLGKLINDTSQLSLSKIADRSASLMSNQRVINLNNFKQHFIPKGEYLLTFYDQEWRTWTKTIDFQDSQNLNLPSQPNTLSIQFASMHEGMLYIDFQEQYNDFRLNTRSEDINWQLWFENQLVDSGETSGASQIEVTANTLKTGTYKVVLTKTIDETVLTDDYTFMYSSNTNELKGHIFTIEDTTGKIVKNAIAKIYRPNDYRYNLTQNINFFSDENGEIFVPQTYLLEGIDYVLSIQAPDQKIHYLIPFVGSKDKIHSFSNELLRKVTINNIPNGVSTIDLIINDNRLNRDLPRIVSQYSVENEALELYVSSEDHLTFRTEFVDLSNNIAYYADYESYEIDLSTTNWNELNLPRIYDYEWFELEIDNEIHFNKIFFSDNLYSYPIKTYKFEHEDKTYSLHGTNIIHVKDNLYIIDYKPLNLYSSYIQNDVLHFSFSNNDGAYLRIEEKTELIFELYDEENNLIQRDLKNNGYNQIKLNESLNPGKYKLVLVAGQLPIKRVESTTTNLIIQEQNSDATSINKLKIEMDNHYQLDNGTVSIFYKNNSDYEVARFRYSKETDEMEKLFSQDVLISEDFIFTYYFSANSGETIITGEKELKGEDIFKSIESDAALINILEASKLYSIQNDIEFESTYDVNAHLAIKFINNRYNYQRISNNSLELITNKKMDDFVIQLNENENRYYFPLGIFVNNDSILIVKSATENISKTFFGEYRLGEFTNWSIPYSIQERWPLNLFPNQEYLPEMALEFKFDFYREFLYHPAWKYNISFTRPIKSHDIFYEINNEVLAEVELINISKHGLDLDLLLHINNHKLLSIQRYVESNNMFKKMSILNEPIREYEGYFNRLEPVPIQYDIIDEKMESVDSGTMYLNEQTLFFNNGLDYGNYTLKLTIPTEPNKSLVLEEPFELVEPLYLYTSFPEHGYSTNQSSITVRGKTNAKITPTIKLLKNNQEFKEAELTVDTAGNFAITFNDLTEGSYYGDIEYGGEWPYPVSFRVDWTPPPPVTGLSYTQNDTTVTLSWNDQHQAETYNVYQHNQSGKKTLLASNLSSLTYTLEKSKLSTGNLIEVTTLDPAGNESPGISIEIPITSTPPENPEPTDPPVVTPPVVNPPTTNPPVVTPPTDDVVVIEDGKVVVSKDKLEELFASSEARIGLDLSDLAGDTLPPVVFDSEALGKMKATQSIVLQLPNQQIELPAAVLQALAKEGDQVELNVEEVTSTEDGAISSQLNFNMNTYKDGKATAQTKFAAPITVSMKLNKAPADPRKVAVFYLNGDAKTYMGGAVIEGMVTFTTDHFSSFVALEGNKTFTDLPSYAKEAVEVLASRGIINGKTDTRYGSGDSITRAEFAVLVARALALPTESYKGTFTDVPASMKWAAQHIEAANQADIINGYSKTSFKPGEKINRQEMAAMIVRALKYQNPDITVDESKFVNFLDSSDISSFAKKDVAMASAMGIINGFKSGNGYEFRPKQTATRGEAAKMLFEMLY